MSHHLPPDHPERLSLAGEVHARPPLPIDSPARVSHVAVMVDPGAREAERAHLDGLCTALGVAPPQAQATHFSAVVGPLQLKWERHGEFASYTFHLQGDEGEAFATTAIDALPAGWLAALPGQTVAATHALVRQDFVHGDVTPAALAAECFGGQTVVGAEIAEGAALACTDYRVRDDGFGRVVLVDRSLTTSQTGRVLQRLFEIEAYRVMALLALPIARELQPRIVTIERALKRLTEGIAAGQGEPGHDEALLHELTRLAAEIESGLSSSQFRFGACRAYASLVAARITELREQRLPGVQTIDEFMTRRFRPAVDTCQTVSQRLHDLSERVAQASGLLRTRVEIARERQNQILLASMDRRARLQLRLQQTVEGLSVAAITYYVAGLVGYLAKGAAAAGWPLDPDLATGLALPVVVLAVMLGVRRVRRHLRGDAD